MLLLETFEKLNLEFFDGFLDPPELRWNSRFRASAGKFFPGNKKHSEIIRPVIEIAKYLLQEKNSEKLIRDTMAHEMIHYWLWVRRRPYGHTQEFELKMKQMGTCRYNSVPKLRVFRYLYRCPACTRDFPTRKKMRLAACAKCCKKFSKGKFDSRFQLYLYSARP